MYKCQVTGKNSKESEKLNKITVEVRTKSYEHWDYEAEEKWFSHGSEIVREINVSAEGLSLWTSWTKDQQDLFVKSLS